MDNISSMIIIIKAMPPAISLTTSSIPFCFVLTATATRFYPAYSRSILLLLSRSTDEITSSTKRHSLSVKFVLFHGLTALAKRTREHAIVAQKKKKKRERASVSVEQRPAPCFLQGNCRITALAIIPPAIMKMSLSQL